MKSKAGEGEREWWQWERVFQLKFSEEFSLRKWWCLDRSALESQSKKRKPALWVPGKRTF